MIPEEQLDATRFSLGKYEQWLKTPGLIDTWCMIGYSIFRGLVVYLVEPSMLKCSSSARLSSDGYVTPANESPCRLDSFAMTASPLFNRNPWLLSIAHVPYDQWGEAFRVVSAEEATGRAVLVLR